MAERRDRHDAAPFLGYGVGLRLPHYAHALAGGLDVDFIEVVSENFFGDGGRPHAVLARARADLPVVFHGVSLGIGNVAPPSAPYLSRLKALIDRYEPAWVSDHLCWSGYGGVQAHDLLPLPHTEEALSHVVAQVARVQDFLGRRLLLENVSSYARFCDDAIPEWQFLSEVAERADCLLLLDVNNIIVNAANHGFAPEVYVDAVSAERVAQLHVANHSDRGAYRLDSHRGKVPHAVWMLYERALSRFGPVSTIIEWDEDVPEWETLRAEQQEARRRGERVLAAGAPPSAFGAPAPASSALPAGGAVRSLDAVQSLFFQAITWPTGVAPFLASAAACTRRAFEETFASTAALGSIERLDVYANAYFYRLHDVLAEQFSVLSWLLGPARFNDLVTEYLLACPSRDGDIRRAGDRLAGYVAGHRLGTLVPCASDVAAIEGALGAALTAADESPLDWDSLSGVATQHWPSLVFTLAASVRLLPSRCDYDGLLKRRAEGGSASDGVEAAPDERMVLVFRTAHTARHRTLATGEGAALLAVAAREPFGAACARAHAADPELSAEQMASWVKEWLAAGLLTAAEMA